MKASPLQTRLGIVAALSLCGPLAFANEEKAGDKLGTPKAISCGVVDGVEFLVVGPFDGAMNASHGPEKNPDPVCKFDVKTGQALKGETGMSWRPHQAGRDGTLDLAPLFSAPKISAYAL